MSTKLEVKDVWHYYIGAEFIFTYNGNNQRDPAGSQLKATLSCFTQDGFLIGMGKDVVTGEDWEYEIDGIETDGTMQLILIHKDDMTVTQRKQYNLLDSVDSLLGIHYLLKSHIDIFDLIDRGLCIRKTFTQPYKSPDKQPCPHCGKHVKHVRAHIIYNHPYEYRSNKRC